MLLHTHLHTFSVPLKVSSGGIIAGDDYNWGQNDGYSVKRAVHDFVKENDLEDKLEILGSQFIIKLSR